MTTGVSEEASFPDTTDNLEGNARKVLIKQAALWFRIHGLLDRILTAVKHLAALIVRMENRAHGPPPGPPDYPQAPWVNYGDHRPHRDQEPSWQRSLMDKIVAPLIVLGLPAILAALWTMNTKQEQMNGRLSRSEEHQTGDQNLVIQRLNSMDKHHEATDRRVDAIERELWPHKH